MSGIDLTLDRIHVLFNILPRYDRPTCHIAGTNGKGSVSAFLTSIFRSASPSYRVGRYNSPHLVSVYDCITIDDVPVSPEVYGAARTRVEKANEEHKTGATSFEVLTLTALQVFQDLKVDIAVVEVGMGGRLDATNVIPDDCILVSGLTAVDLDHQAFLGNTVADIAREKVAIARPGRPFVLSPQQHASVSLVAQEYCEKIGASLVQALVPSIRPWNVDADGPQKTNPKLTAEHFLSPEPQPVQISLRCFSEPLKALLPLQGEHQLTNLGTALTMVSAILTDPLLASSSLDLHSRITPTTTSKGIRSTVWNGRLSFHKLSTPQSNKDLLVLADGAHNPASSATLGAYITDLLSRISNAESAEPRTITLTYILSLSHSPPKTPLQTLSPLLPPTFSSSNIRLISNVALLRFTPPEGMPWVKSVSPSDLKSTITSLAPEAEVWVASDEASPEGQLKEVFGWVGEKHARAEEGLVVVAGSLYLVADFYRLLGESNV
ncbi:Mur ligase [Cristinia sonorae]|uniref:Mur ligase n=1 Tax=Cristinia sonorae TaxID=1940300 RepID=A0A8K0UVR0_9AGAR|nr:Mur ligase [Cristinia sonorae]